MNTNWRERALERSQVITDAWEVTKTWAGRIADWILFGCMLVNIVEIIATIPIQVSNVVLGVQVVMLDVGGFSLATMAEQAREQEDEQAARKASFTGYFLISVTILTLLLVTVGLLWPTQTKHFTDGAEKALILVRIVMTVIYGHVIHGLRRATAKHHQATVTDQFTDLSQRLTDLSEHMRATDRRLTDLSEHVRATDVRDRLSDTDRRLTDLTDRLSDSVAALHTIMQEQTDTLMEMATLPARLSELERSLSSRASGSPRQPRLSVVAPDRPVRSVSVPTPVGSDQPTDSVTDTDKGAFVRHALTDHPTMRVSDIQRLAAGQGMTIAHSYISDIRKTFRVEQEKQAQQETA